VFDIDQRSLQIYYQGETEDVERALHSLDLGAEKESTAKVKYTPEPCSNTILKNSFNRSLH